MSEADPWAAYLPAPDPSKPETVGQGAERGYATPILAEPVADPAAVDPWYDYLEQPEIEEGAGGSLGAAARGTLDTLTFGLADEGVAGLDTLFGRNRGSKTGWDAGFTEAFEHNLRQQRDLIGADEALHPTARTVGQLAGAVVPGIGAARTATSAGRLALTAGTEGAAYGLGSGEGLEDRLLKGAEYGAASAVLAPGINKAVQATAPFARKRVRTLVDALGLDGATDASVEAADAALRQGVTLNPADVRPGLRGLQAVAEGLPVTDTVIRSGIQRNVDSVEAALTREAERQGTPLDVTGLGERVEEGARKFISSSRDQGGRLYDEAATLAGDVRVTPQTAAGEIMASLADLGKLPNTNKAKIAQLQDVLIDLTDESGAVKSLDVQTIRDLRTAMREALPVELRGSDLDRRLGMVLDAASDDMFAALEAKSPAAAKAFRDADQYWKARVETIDDALAKVIGKKGDQSAEQIAAKLNSMASVRGNADALEGVLSAIPPDARGDVAATLLTQLGRKTPEADFSINTFLTQYEKLSPRARTVLFGKEGQAALADLAKASKAMQGSLRQLNATNSGKVTNYLLTLFGGGAAYGAAGPAGVVGLGALGLGAGKLLSSPVVARWLARAPKLRTPTETVNHIQQLGPIAANVPAVRNEVLALQQRLLEALSEPPQRLAAEEEPDDVRGEPPQ